MAFILTYISRSVSLCLGCGGSWCSLIVQSLRTARHRQRLISVMLQIFGENSLPSNIICKSSVVSWHLFVARAVFPPFLSYIRIFFQRIFFLLFFALINSMEIPETHTKWGSSLLQDVKLSAFRNFPNQFTMWIFHFSGCCHFLSITQNTNEQKIRRFFAVGCCNQC